MPALISRAPSVQDDRGTTSFFLAVALTVVCLAAVLAGWFPIGFSILTVFLFAGPHNWFEARYFLTRLPGRWGKLRPFFVTAGMGILLLTISFALLPWISRHYHWTNEHWHAGLSLWNSLLIAWVLLLIQMRSRQNPRRDWSWTVPVAFLVVAGVWMAPYVFSLTLVYLHPVMALWILDRELARRRSPWRRAYRFGLVILPVVVGVLYWRLHAAPHLMGNDDLTQRITQHAGGGLFRGVSSHFLVAVHTFLEMIHYAVWLVAIPLVGLGNAPWHIGQVPLARRSRQWRWLLGGVLVLGFGLVVLLWGCFLWDYAVTRDVYFTMALVHVLAEVPFLLRAL